LILHDDGSYRPERENLPAPARRTMPADWSDAFGHDFLGRVCYRRTFQKPTGLDTGARVWLVIEPARSDACITVKKKLVGFLEPGDSAKRFDITDRLEDHNQLEIFVDHPANELIDGHPVYNALKSKVGNPELLGPGGLIGEVRLEIEE
jgi:beta-galactosidase